MQIVKYLHSSNAEEAWSCHPVNERQDAKKLKYDGQSHSRFTQTSQEIFIESRYRVSYASYQEIGQKSGDWGTLPARIRWQIQRVH